MQQQYNAIDDRLAAGLRRSLSRHCSGYSFPVLARCVPEFIALLTGAHDTTPAQLQPAVRRIVLEHTHHDGAGDAALADESAWLAEADWIVRQLVKLHAACLRRRLWSAGCMPPPMYG